MAFSYSFHISSKGHSVSTKGKVNQVGRHNLREYKSDEYDKSKIDVMVGDGSMMECIERVYHREFDEALERYNQGKRADRKIEDYLEHISNSANDMAVEVIVQIGDMDFWKDKSESDKRKMSEVFKDQLDELNRVLPEFKVASAVAHYDEASPHLHIVGVPVASGYKKGLEVQCSKRKVFTQESLKMLQEVMHENAEKNIASHPEIFGNKELKEKEVGRNKDIPKQSLQAFYELKEEVKELNHAKAVLKYDVSSLSERAEITLERVRKLETEKSKVEDEISVLKAQRDKLEVSEQVLMSKFFEKFPKIKDMYEKFKELWRNEMAKRAEKREANQEVKERNRASVRGTLEEYQKQIAEQRAKGVEPSVFADLRRTNHKGKTTGRDDR